MSLQPRIRTIQAQKSTKYVSTGLLNDQCQVESAPVPSALPTPYNISIGWKASEFHLGINREGNPRPGMVVNPVGILTVDNCGEFREIGCTVVRMFLQLVDEIVDDL